MHLNLAALVGRGTVDPVANLFAVVEETQRKGPNVAHFCLALRTDGSAELDDKRRLYREKARAVGVPVYDEIPAMARALAAVGHLERRSEEHTSELQSLMRLSYAVFCLKKKNKK